MRQGQQNRRGRGRNNRKSQNPLTRSFESNGPDVKIRGTPSHIAEKYVSLARDALSSGDPVLAENHLQHAEHYNRIIMTFREQQTPHGEGINGSGNGRHRMSDQPESEDAPAGEAGEEIPPGQEPQPVMAGSEEESAPAENERPQRRANGTRSPTRRRRSESGQSSERRSTAAPESSDTDGAVEASPRSSQRRETFGDDADQPEFLKRPVRRSRKPASESSDDEPAQAGADDPNE
ncbi:MAG: DUF4167 domain-containing protein [Hyphomicrobiaceae bacterium]